LQNGQNYFNVENWNDFSKSTDYGEVTTFLQNNYSLNVSTFQTLFNDAISK